MKLTGNTILIPDANSPLMVELVKRLYAFGNTLVIGSHSPEDIRKACRPKIAGSKVFKKEFDKYSSRDREKFVQWALKTHPDINGAFLLPWGFKTDAQFHRPVAHWMIGPQLSDTIVQPLHFTGLLAAHLASKKESFIAFFSGKPFSEQPLVDAAHAAIHAFAASARSQLEDTSVRLFEFEYLQNNDGAEAYKGDELKKFCANVLHALQQNSFKNPVHPHNDMQAPNGNDYRFTTLHSVPKAILFGVAIGDALGVPVEFLSREELLKNPITGMCGYGTHSQPPGTWSDDSSLTFCLAESLLKGYDVKSMAGNFLMWLHYASWTAHDEVFDVGITTQGALQNLADGAEPTMSGLADENSNGNGSLMRISPLLLEIHDKPIKERFLKTREVSFITHRHIRSVISCFMYLEFAREILLKKNKFTAFKKVQKSVPEFLKNENIDKREIAIFDRVLKGDISELPESEIKSSGYVVHTLEASIWCFLKTDSYKSAVLKAVNLGDDTDTTGAVTGGLAGLYYGVEEPLDDPEWRIAQHERIEALAEKLQEKYF
ncbi:MAG: ADP-ribosylglycohydrolase family protein [Bacteroidota bacterium]